MKTDKFLKVQGTCYSLKTQTQTGSGRNCILIKTAARENKEKAHVQSDWKPAAVDKTVEPRLHLVCVQSVYLSVIWLVCYVRASN